MRLRYCLLAEKNYHAERAWFDTDRGHRLSDEEVASLVGTQEKWIARFEDGTESCYTATFGEYGWLDGSDIATIERNRFGVDRSGVYGKTTALRAINYEAQRGESMIVALIGPNGERPDLLRVAYRSSGITTNVGRVFLQDEVTDARETFGVRVSLDPAINGWVYGFGSIRHIESVRDARGERERRRFSDEEHKHAEQASFRASVAILRCFGSAFPAFKIEWREAAVETGIEVLIQKNNGPWRAVDGKGRPI